MLFKGNKKGQVEDLFIIMIFSFVIIFTVVVAFQLNGILGTTLNDTLNDTPNITNVIEKTEQAISTFDIMFAILLAGLIISTLIGAFLLDTHPVFFWISLIILVIVIITAALISNIATDTLGGSQFSASYSEFPIMKFFLDNLPLASLVIGALILIALYVKRGSVAV